MQSRSSSSSTTTVLIVLLIVFTFPFWIGILGGLFGIVVGVFGAVFGVIAGVFGAIIGVIGGLFGGIFHWGWGWPHHGWAFGFWSGKLFAIVLTMLIVFFVLIRPRKV